MKAPSIVSSRDMPAAKMIGRQRIAYQGRPPAAAAPAVASKAISVAVSNPSPKRRPSGYICQGFLIAFVARPRIRFIRPRLLSWSSSSASSNSPCRIRRNTRTIPIRMTRLRMPITSRKTPDTLGPITPVSLVQQGSVVGHLAGQALDPPREQRSQHEHDRRVTQREEESDAERPLTVAHQLAGRVVDRGDVVGVEGVPHAERVCRDPDSEAEHGAVAEGELRRHDESEQQPEADDVERGDGGEQTGGPPPLGGRQRVLDALPA